MPKQRYFDKGWFSYNGVGDPYHAASYRRINDKPGGERGPVLNAIYALGHFTPISPLSPNVHAYIANALVASIAQPPLIGKKAKYFVYMRG